ncbi:MAG: hypothetical protein WKG07_34960 [Hymenobacter sp.]
MEHGRYLVNQYNMVKGYQNVFAIGDIALMKTKDYPKGHPQVSPPAMQQGTHLAQNLARERRSEVWAPFAVLGQGHAGHRGPGPRRGRPAGRPAPGRPAGLDYLAHGAYLLSIGLPQQAGRHG